ncbi:hypothetical protein OG471_01360 [Streptomyces sp. NBC_01336]|uniref:hypothetical protein n=1 Tax=Streptomyces sp. NBC_01336 TaxID=2903829 RepID=UPI002E0E9A8E|nr:hypothetical protein OG471_01360 [Streptomyces sp. NBC_01336]
MPDGKMRTYVHGRGKNGVTMSAGYADRKNMSSLLCAAGTKEPGDFEFLASCTGLDVAGIDHAKAPSWLHRAKRETDSLYEKQVTKTGIKRGCVVSGVLASGPVRMVLHRIYKRYSPRILGGAVV